MVEFVGLALVIGLLMFFLIEVSFNLGENYDVLKVLLILVAMILGIVLAHVGKLIVTENGGSAAMETALDITFYVWIVVTVVVLMYFVLFFIIKAWNAMASKKSQEISMENEGDFK